MADSHLISLPKQTATEPPTTTSEAEHSKRRWNAIFRSGAASVVAKAISMACMMLQVPIALKYLGGESFGLWVTLTGAVQMMSFADLGIGLGVQNEVAKAYGKDDLHRAKQISSTGFFLLSGIGLVLFLLFLPVCFYIRWEDVFGLKSPLLRESARQCIFVVGCIFCVGLPFNIVTRFAMGLQMGWINGLVTAFAGMLGLLFVFLTSYLQASVVTFITVALLPLILANIIMGIYLLKKTQWQPSDLMMPDWSMMKKMLGDGSQFLIPQINTMVIFTAPQLIISAALGAAAVTPYNISQRLMNILTQLMQITLGPVWPAYAEARARGNMQWIKKTFKKTFVSTAVISTIACLTFVFAGRKIIQLWTHASQADLPSQNLILLMSFFTFVVTIGQPGFCFLGGCGRLKGMSIYATATSIVFFASVFPMIHYFGIYGALWALIIPYTLLTLGGSLVEIYFWFRSNRATT